MQDAEVLEDGRRQTRLTKFQHRINALISGLRGAIT